MHLFVSILLVLSGLASAPTTVAFTVPHRSTTTTATTITRRIAYSYPYSSSDSNPKGYHEDDGGLAAYEEALRAEYGQQQQQPQEQSSLAHQQKDYYYKNNPPTKPKDWVATQAGAFLAVHEDEEIIVRDHPKAELVQEEEVQVSPKARIVAVPREPGPTVADTIMDASGILLVRENDLADDYDIALKNDIGRSIFTQTADGIDSRLKRAMKILLFFSFGAAILPTYGSGSTWSTRNLATGRGPYSRGSTWKQELARLRGGSVSMDAIRAAGSIRDMALFAFGISSATWLLFAWEVRRSRRGDHAEERICRELRVHRSEKVQFLRQALVPAMLTLTVASLKVKSFPWERALWVSGPRPSLVGQNFAYWAAEVTMDTCLDECKSLQLRKTITWTALLQLVLIAKLTSHRGGHVLFWIKAAEVLIATAFARLIDNVYWLVIAILSVSFLSIAAGLGYLAPIPPEVTRVGFVAYFAATVGSSMVYQVAQNVAGVRIKNIQLLRSLLCGLAVWTAGTPASWIVYDAVNFLIFFGLKVMTDSVAVVALGI